MRKVTTVNLNGNAYQLEEAAYDKLREYLDSAERKLRANPDRAEILADLEQSIADKCDTCLGAHKTVVSEREVDQILREMGPVDGVAPDVDASTAGPDARPSPPPGADAAASVAGDPPGATGTSGEPRRKRIYRLPSEGMLGGVCAGWAAYLDIDVVWVRLAFVLLTFATGVWFFIWLAMLCVMPSAETPEEIAAAHGEPLNAREVIERAKKKASDSAARQRDGEHWKRFGDDWKRFGDDMKQAGHSMASGFADAGENVREYSHRLRDRARRRAASRHRRQLDVSPGARLAAGISLPFLSLISAVLFVAFILTLLSLVTNGHVFGLVPWLPAPMPIWVAVILICVVYGIVAGPIGAARRQAQRYVNDGARGWAGVADGLLWTMVVVALLWLAWHFAPEVRDWIHALPASTRAGFTV